jgi:hypothetical protein
MFVPDTTTAILGTIEFVLALVFLTATAIRALGALKSILGKLMDRPSSVDLTLNQFNMHEGSSDLGPDTTPYAASRNIRQSLKRGG